MNSRLSHNVLLSSGDFEKERNYWNRVLDGRPEPSHFPYEKTANDGNGVASLRYSFDAATTKSLQSISNGSPYGMYLILLSAVCFLLYRYTGKTDVILGMPVFRQKLRQQYVNNMLPIRSKITSALTFQEFLLEIKDVVARANEHQNIPSTLLSELLPQRGSADGVANLPVMVAFEPIHDMTAMQNGEGTNVFCFRLVTDGQNETQGDNARQTLEVELRYDSARYREDSRKTLLGHLENCLSRIVSDSSQLLSGMTILSDAERHDIIDEFNATTAAYSRETLIQELFEKQAARVPENIALVFKDQRMTYSELDKKANQLARLLQERGIGKGDLVAVLLNRSMDMIVAVLGILKAGAAYVPLEPSYPYARIKNILESLKISMALTHYAQLRQLQSMQWELPELTGIVVLDVDTQEVPPETVNAQDVENLWDYVAKNAFDAISAAGFRSSYTGQLFSEYEVNFYIRRVMDLVLAHCDSETSILEIGCGTGLMIPKLLPNVGRYIGLDSSKEALAYTRNEVEALRAKTGCEQPVELIQGYAHELAEIATSSCDVVLMSSIVQFFPGYMYLYQVLREVERVLKPGGVLVVADILDPKRIEDFKQSLVDYKREHPDDTDTRSATNDEHNLYVASEFFANMSAIVPGYENIEVHIRDQGFHNELQYRYDVIIRKSKDKQKGGLISELSPLLTAWHVAIQEESNMVCSANSDDLAYIIHTSGSTGVPKGVAVKHKPVINLIEWVNKSFNVSVRDRLLFVTSLCFDLSVYDIFGVLAAGGSLRIASESDIRNPARLFGILATEGITFWDSAPAALGQLVPFMQEGAKKDGDYLGGLRLVFLSGDWIPVPLPDTVRACFPGANVISLGGATEATVWSNFYPIGEVDPNWPSIPYGKPIQNARYYILDADLQPCPVGIEGDLYIGGECLANGYINDPELSASKFLRDPFVTARAGREDPPWMYKTGDRARLMADGNMEFLGRKDFQVKIRGYRIELGEIESRMLKHKHIKEATVQAWDDESGGKSLYAYFVSEEDLTSGELRQWLLDELPDYMLPKGFYRLDCLPLNTSGKIDRHALRSYEQSIRSGTGHVPPHTDEEKALAQIWQEVLGVEKVGVHDNFFDLGGDSLKAIRIASGLRGYILDVGHLLRFPTIHQVAAYISADDSKPGEPVSSPTANLHVDSSEIDATNSKLKENNLALEFLEVRPVHDMARGCIMDSVASIILWAGQRFELSYAEAWGFAFHESTERKIGRRVDPAAGPTEPYLERFHGIRPRAYNSMTVPECTTFVRECLDKKQPVIVNVDTFHCPWDEMYHKNHNLGHFVIAVGMDDDAIYVTDPYYLKYAERFEAWEFEQAFGGSCITLSFVSSMEKPNSVPVENTVDWRELLASAVNRLTPDAGPDAFAQIRKFGRYLSANSIDFPVEQEGFAYFESAPLSFALIEVMKGRLQFARLLDYLAKKFDNSDLAALSVKLETAGGKWDTIRGMIRMAAKTSDPDPVVRRAAQKIMEVADYEEAIADEILSLCVREKEMAR